MGVSRWSLIHSHRSGQALPQEWRASDRRFRLATMTKVDTVTLKIPRPLYDRLQHVIEGTGFRSVTEFVLYVLRDLAGDEAHDMDTVKKRLEDLGYL
jgi:hypothetical protein